MAELNNKVSELEERLSKGEKELAKKQDECAKLQRDLRENVAQKEDQVKLHSTFRNWLSIRGGPVSKRKEKDKCSKLQQAAGWGEDRTEERHTAH